MATVFGLSLSVGLAAGLAAQEAVDLMNHQPTEQELIDALKPQKMLTRGIRPIGQADEEPEPATAGTPTAVDLNVQFNFNSAELTPTAKHLLTTLANALHSDSLNPYSFMVEGHTDASGSDHYNLTLSERRAAVVRDFLTSQQGVTPEKLSAVGMGETDLLDPSQPDDARNRRVRIRNLN
jgi:outer membrane protein OmpA-like peptidoglycan-associated protein